MSSDVQGVQDQQRVDLSRLLDGCKAPPQIMRLLEQLLARITKRQAEQRSRHEDLVKARTRYLTKAILLQEVQAACQNADLSSPGLQKLAHRRQVAETLQRLTIPRPASESGTAGAAAASAPAVSRAASSAMFGADVQGSTTQWLGVTAQDLISTCDDTPTDTLEVRGAAVPLITKSLQRRLRFLYDTLQLPWPDECEYDSHSASQVTPAEYIARRDAACQQQRLKAALTAQQHLVLTERLLSLIMSTITDMHSFMDKELLGRQQQVSQVHTEHAGALARVLCHKISHVEMQLLGTIYTGDNLRALMKIHDQLAKQARAVDNQLQEMRGLVSAYEALGPEYQQVVSAYTRVCAELRSAQQTLSTLTELESELRDREYRG